MSWKSGSSLADSIIDAIEAEVPDFETRKRIYKPIIEAFEDHDCDTLDGCEDEDGAFNETLKELHPDWYEDEDN